jgi:cytochrome P450
MTDQIATERTGEEAMTAMFDWLARMRATERVRPDEQQPGFWHVFGYAEMTQAMSDPATFSSDAKALIPHNEDTELFFNGNFIGVDPPRHRELRGLVSKAFTPRFVAELEPRIELVSDLSYPLPVSVISELLGVPAEDWGLFRGWAEALLAQGGQSGMPTDVQVEGITPTAREMNAYLLDHIGKRRANPGEDLISKLIAAVGDGRRLADDEIVGFAALLLLAGHLTTTALVGNSVLYLAENPDALAALRANRTLVPLAIEEVLRLRPPLVRFFRLTTRPVEVGGKDIPAGQVVALWAASANRDEAQFPDPDRFDHRRDPNRHVTFGHGIHFCIAAPLARLEARIALNLLLDRYAEMAVPGDDPVEFTNPMTLIGLSRLPLDVAAA